MAPDKVKDLEKELSTIAKFENMNRKSEATFYVKSKPFLHFHEKDDRRWADVKTATGWKEVPIPFGAKASERASFLKTVSKLYRDFVGKSDVTS